MDHTADAMKAALSTRLRARQVSAGYGGERSILSDFIFGFYRQQPDATPATITAAYETFAPGWCQALAVCRNGQFILLPGSTFGPTMTGLELAFELVESHVTARPFIPFIEAE